ncbi:Gfo/Idh/MocA family protein [Labilibacter marinus]|uniref:Gfo/Idh/MocA family protein n=1 Tax=Labilibacter marinus TaxID=1477105 RepID=UPI0008377B90|nr:Gfo/Idh/MocA family oxidoreductase [Labilibacter marinus]
MDRRKFIKNISLTSASGIVVPSIISSSVLSGCGRTAPSDKIRLAQVGLGGMGNGNTSKLASHEGVELVALCDIDKNRLSERIGKLQKNGKNKGIRQYTDYRELLDDGEIDAVMIAVPDHWHAKLYTDFADAKIDIYGEKPLVRRIREGRIVSDAVRNNKVVFQTGSWQRSTEIFIKACELVNSGAIGEVNHLDVALLKMNRKIGMPPIIEVPAAVNYDLWQGPASEKPFRGVLHKHWRWQREYSGGTLTDWVGHHYDIAAWSMNLEYTGPVEIEGSASFLKDELFNAPRNFEIKLRFKNDVTMRIAEHDKFDKGMGIYWRGDKGWIHVGRDGISASDDKILETPIASHVTKFRHNSKTHHSNFIDCIKTRERPISDVESAHRAISVGLLGEIACITNEKLKWNPDKEELIGASAQANAFLRYDYRKPWALKGL